MSKNDENMEAIENEDYEVEDEKIENEDEESSDEDDYEMDETKNESEYQENLTRLKTAIEENKFFYQNYIDILKLSKDHGDYVTLKMYREKMSEQFPLTENLWLDWLKDEEKYVESLSDKEKLIELFERATQDYLSVDIWLEYIQFSIGLLTEPNGEEKIRLVCESALKTAGYHINKGYLIWETYREFENAILAGLQQSLMGSTNTKAAEEKISQQIDRIGNLFRRQLMIPLDELEATFEEFKQFDDSKIDEKLLKQYDDALKKLKELNPYEDKILQAQSSEQKLQAYKDYIEFELRLDEKNVSLNSRIQCLFERAIADDSNCLDTSLWILYTSYLVEKTKSREERQNLLNVYNRGTRNIPWCVKMWTGKALLLEQNETNEDDVKKIFNDGMNAGLQTSQDYLELWQAFLDFLKRKINWNSENLADSIESLREIFQRAINQLFQYFKHEGDPTFSLEKYWAHTEAKYIKDMEQARKIWNEMIIQKGMGKYSQEWIEYFNFEREFGDEKHQRKVLYRALNEVTDSPEVICDLLLKFEKYNGSIDSYWSAYTRVSKELSKISEESAKKAKNIPNDTSNNKKQKNKKQEKKDKVIKKENAPENKLKRKTSEDDYQLKEKNEATVKIEPTKDSDGFAIPTLPTSKTSPILPPSAKKVKNGDPIVTSKPLDKPIVQAILNETGTGKKTVSNNSVFISNLAYDADVNEISKAFEKSNGFKEVRLVKHWSGKSRGYGYVDFDTQQNAIEALKLDRTLINGRPMYVSQCEDKSLSFGGSKFKYATNLEKNKLFVANLPFSVDKAQLEDIFKNFGKLKEVRVATYKSGKSKGLAYVEFEDEASATKALIQTDNMIVGDNQISVAISNPPRRNAPKDENPVESSLGPGNVKAGLSQARGKSHMIDLTPRSLATKKQSIKNQANEDQMQIDQQKNDDKVATSQMQNIQLNEKSKMSNADFRSMLLNKK